MDEWFGEEGEGERRTFDHSVFLIEGSNHSYHLALHCLGVFRTKREEIRALDIYVGCQVEKA